MTSAKLVVWHVPEPAWGLDVAKNNPLQVRGLVGFLGERLGVRYLQIASPIRRKRRFRLLLPREDHCYGEAIKFEVDLLKGPGEFAKALKAASDTPDRELGLALTLAQPFGTRPAAVYKVLFRRIGRRSR